MNNRNGNSFALSTERANSSPTSCDLENVRLSLIFTILPGGGMRGIEELELSHETPGFDQQ